MTSSTSDRRGRFLASAAVAMLLFTGCTANPSTHTVGLQDSDHTTRSASAPASPNVTAPVKPQTSAAPAVSPRPSVPQEVMAASIPVSIQIPSSGTQSELLSLGLRDDGTLEVPPDGPGAPAAWFNGSPTPGERGPAVVLGHVNATGGGPGVFAGLRTLKAGDNIEVTRQDGSTAVFAFDRGEQYPKNAFPTQSVYGNTQGAELRLITCDGYDPDSGEFADNYVVYAKLIQ
jgi:Sortase domain